MRFPWHGLGRKLGRWLGLLLALFVVVATVCFGQNSPAFPPKIRGVWLTNVDSNVLYDPTQLKTAIADLKNTNFNTLYPTVWNDGHTLYPSAVAQQWLGQNQDDKLGDRDMLAEVINLGKEKSFRVIPWFEFGFMAPAESEWLKNHPHWLTANAQGETVWLEGGIIPRVWLNPLHPEVQQLITALLVDLVRRYDVDGIQLDDHFGYPYNFGYDPITIELYRQETGKEPPPPPELNLNQNCVSSNPVWQQWTDWRSAKISRYVQNLVPILKAIKPDLVISISPNPQTFSKNCFLLDWQTWQQAGVVDELVLQIYREKQESFTGELQQSLVQQTKVEIPVVVGILSGLKNRPIPPQRIQQQVQWVDDQGFAGTAFFFYESLWNLEAETSPNPFGLRQQWQRLYRRLNR
ncbi:family 10 glycosylhydrolase [Synechocystis salina LEGE 06155]|nr:family 10 glycosylhydrolase [Synechocystis salina LEGE 06155]